MKNKLLFSLLIISALSAGSCSSTKSLSGMLKSLTGNNWELVNLMGQPAYQGDFGGTLPFLSFQDGGRLTGSTGCNTMRGNYNLMENGLISLDPGSLTRKACEGNGEARVLDALKSVTNLKLDKGRLSLLDGATEVLSFAAKK